MRTLIFISLLGVSFAQFPTRCESPLEWEARRVKAVPNRGFQEVGSYYYDAVNERTRAIEDVQFGIEREFFDVLHLYKENKEYRLNINTRNCTVGVPPHPFFRVGIPEGSQFLFEAELGPAEISNEHLTIQNWEISFSDGAKYDISVTTPNCIPVGAVYISPTFGNEYYNYFNIRAGIQDPAIFNVPTECLGL